MLLFYIVQEYESWKKKEKVDIRQKEKQQTEGKCISEPWEIDAW